MKSYELYVQGIYKAILSQVAEEYPELLSDCERDLTSLLSGLEYRGFGFPAIALVDMGKHFDRCLAHERLTPSGLPLMGSYKKGTPIPRLFKGLMLRVFEVSGVLRTDPDVRAIAFLRQLYQAAKRIEVACTDSRTWKTVHEFFQIESEVRPDSLNWDADELCLSNVHRLHLGDVLRTWHDPLFPGGVAANGSRDSVVTDPDGVLEVIQRVADRISAGLGWFEPTEWRAKHGPGAVSDLKSHDYKYDFVCWPDKLEYVFHAHDFEFSSEEVMFWNHVQTSSLPSIVMKNDSAARYESPSRLIAVPKTYKAPRLIAAEPVAHQYCQQVLLDFLKSRIKSSALGLAIQLNDQTGNQNLCRLASLSGSHSTIDLSSASDRVSCWLVERVFRSNTRLLQSMHACRTRWVVNHLDKKNPTHHKLRKFACMGSALTFPVQSIVFFVLAVGCVLQARNLRVTSSTVRQAASEVQVYGDDLIVPADSTDLLIRVIDCLGLKVNRDKTFSTGRFRESCGTDYFAGVDVTPVKSRSYPKGTRPESISGLVETHNNFRKKGYDLVAEFIRTTVDSQAPYRFPEVSLDSGVFGWAVYDPDNSHLRTRWNADLHRREYSVTTFRTKVSRNKPNKDSGLLQFFTEAQFGGPGRDPIDLGVGQRPRTLARPGWVSL